MNKFNSPANIRKACIAGLMASTVPVAILSMPGAAMAADVSNSATITAPAGAIETNTSNNSVTDTTEILAVIVATDDSATGVYGLVGSTEVLNVFDFDSINGATVNSTNAILSLANGTNVPTGLTFDMNSGAVGVNPSTPAGTYTFDYQICDSANTANCKTATVTVTVVAPVIAADPDSVGSVNGAVGANDVLDVLSGDTLDGAEIAFNQIIMTVVTPATPLTPGAPVPTLDVSNGLVDVPAGTPAGVYSIEYKICDAVNPTVCATNTATITVDGSPIVANDDAVTNINGLTGATAVVNAFTGDTINGVDATTDNAILSLPSGSTVPAGLTFNTTTGNVDVAPGTPAGTYSFNYQICEKLNPTNCEIATILVTVTAAAIDADPDSVAGINGVTGANGVLDVLPGDTLNGTQVTLSQINMAVVTPAAPVTAGASVPTLNTTTGLIDVPAGTPAGTYSIEYTICEKINTANCATNIATVTVSPSVDLAITKTDGKTNVAPGETITYSITVTNFGPDTATGALLKDEPGAGLTCAAGNALTFSGNGIPVGSFTVGDLTGAGVTLGSLAKDQNITVTYSCTVN